MSGGGEHSIFAHSEDGEVASTCIVEMPSDSHPKLTIVTQKTGPALQQRITDAICLLAKKQC